MTELVKRQIELSNGDRLWLLLGPGGIPDFDTTIFMVAQYQEGKAANTQKNIADAVRVVKRFEVKQRIRIKTRLREGRILMRSEVASLVADCGRPLGKQRMKKDSTRVLPFRSQNSVVNEPSLDSNSQRIRSFYAGEYIKFLVENETAALPYDNQRRQHLETNLMRFEELINKLVPAQAAANFDPEKPLTQEAMTKIKGILSEDPSNLANLLFKQPKTRKRNLLLIEVLVCTGARASEVARLRLDDIDQDTSTIWFRRNIADSRRDVRKNRPGFKTRERPIRVSQDLMRRLAEFIAARKGGRPRNAKHKYVFCSNGSDARALSLGSIYRVVRSLENAFGEGWKKRISPHVLRHTFFDMWFREANDQYDFRNNPQLFDQVIAAAELTGGWKPDSKMVQHYKQRFVFEQASEVTLGTQRRMLSAVKKGKAVAVEI